MFRCLALSSIVLLLPQLACCDELERPHIVLIMADDLGWMDLNCQGNDKLLTPRLDRLATQGVRFTQAYAAAPVCSPTRAALITGLAPARLKITQHGADVPAFWPEDRVVQPAKTEHELSTETTTLAERLHDVGYACGFFGKWHLGGSEEFWPTRHGFDVNVGGCGYGGPPTYFDPYRIPTLPPRKEGEYLTDRLADETIQFMRDHHQEPMFVCLWTYNPHYPFEAPEELIEHFRGKEGPGLINSIYGGQIEATDRAIGRVLDELDKLEIADETVVVFTSDNGGWSGATDNRPLRDGKGYIYEGGLRVPLLIRWPGVTRESTTLDSRAITMDITATLIDAAGIQLEADEVLDGQSLRPLLAGEEWKPQPLFFHYPHFAFHKANRPASAIVEGDWKLIHFYDDDSDELYRISTDISEQTDVADEFPSQAESMKKQLLEWLSETRAELPQRR